MIARRTKVQLAIFALITMLGVTFVGAKYAQLNHQRDTIDATLDELPSALHSIDLQRHDLVRMLRSLAHLSGVGTRVIKLSKDSTVATLRQLSPVLSQLQASGQDFVNAFQVALTYPFVDEVVGRDPQVARNLQMGDYTNLSIKLDISLDQDGSLPIPTGVPTTLPSLPTRLPTDLPTSEITKILGDVTRCLRSGDITSKACKKVLGDPQELLRLLEKCQKAKHDDNPVCQVLNALPSLPTSGPLPSLSLPTGILGGGLTGDGFGVNRTAFGPRGPTMRQLSRMYDPALVDLLVPGMVVSR
jgi:phospholipid/cholesterol/gamma-HCH transport system substrate-binding protein